MRHFIFSYGTLAHKNVAEITAETTSYTPAYLAGYQRNFKALIEPRKFAAAGVHENAEAKVLGMLVEVPENSLAAFDKRESHYDRIEIEADKLTACALESMPEGKYYLYIPQNPENPHLNIPMVQSYMDVIIDAFLCHNEGLAKEVVQSFLEHANDPLLNDRQQPRYSRSLKSADTEKIDKLMKSHATCMIDNRSEIQKELILNEALASSIVATLKFYDLFQFPLTLAEVKENLYGYSQNLHIKEVEGTLNLLIENGYVAELKGYYVLSGSERNIETRKTRKFIAEKFWNRTKLYGQYMRMIPFVKMVAVCNNLAYDNPSELSDIDLFIVIKNRRMWTSRLLLTLVLHFFGVRRHGNKVAGRFCLSFFVTEKAMDLEKISLQPEDPYLAYWMKNLKPIFGDETFADFTEKNHKWLESYGLEFDQKALKHLYVKEKNTLKNVTELILKGWFGNLVETLLKKTLKKKTLKGIQKLGPEASVVVSDNMLKFHNHDKRKDIYEAWKKELNFN